MTTTTTATAAAAATNAEDSLLSSSLFNIQYPNCQRGMFSLRQPFKDMTKAVVPTEQRQASTRKLKPAATQPTVINTDPNPPVQEIPVEPAPVPARQKSKRSAEVQCSLLRPTKYHDMGVQTNIDRQRTAPVNQLYDESDRAPPQYYRQRKTQPIEQNQKVYEIWDVKSARLPTMPPNQTIRRKEIPRARHVRNRRPIIEYPDDEEIESDYDDERIVYTRQPRKAIKKSYLPPNVRMICVRDDANRASY